MELTDLIPIMTIVLLGTSVAGYLQGRRAVHQRRAAELEGAAIALSAHYEAVEAIVDDPALPLAALEMLGYFSDGISDRKFCERFTDRVLMPLTDEDRDRAPAWFYDMDALRKTRPDLAANFFKALGSGLAAAFLRWPGTANKIPQFAALLSQGDRKEAAMAERVSEITRAARRNDSNHHNGGIPQPA